MSKQEPIIVVLAAGMGSRYGGLKQIDAFGPNGEFLLEYSLYDAVRAGFKRAVFITGKAMEDFPKIMEERVGDRIEKAYAPQLLEDKPAQIEIPEGREKPWGTAHALLAARELIDAPFAVINSDDYYGPSTYQLVYDYLAQEAAPGEALMVNFILGKTLSKTGHVARGVCEIGEDGYLKHIVERTKIKDDGDQAIFTEDDGETWQPLSKDKPVSMNFWGFHQSIMPALEACFLPALERNLPKNPLKYEYLLPTVVDELLQAGQLKVVCKQSAEKWYGVTYHEDKASLTEAIRAMIAEGLYPEKLWD